MSYIKRITAFILILSFVLITFNYSTIGYGQQGGYNIALRVKRPSDTQPLLITESSVTLKWNAVPDANHYIIKYRSLEDSHNFKEIIVSTVDGTEKEIRNLKANFIYNFKIEARKDDDIIQINPATDNINILTRMTFEGSRPVIILNPDDNIDEIGNQPELIMEITVPQEWIGSTGNIENLLGNGYNYRIDIGNNKEATSLGAFYIEYSTVEQKYKFIKEEFDYSTNTLIKKDITLESEFTANNSNDGKFKFILNEQSLPSIAPGTIYYATVAPIFTETEESSKYTDERFKYGNSPVIDKKQNKAYTYTYLYVKLSTGNNETILMEVDQVNKNVTEQGNVGDFSYIVKSAKTSNVEDYGLLEGTTDGKYLDKVDPVSFIIVNKEFQTTYYYWVKAQSAQQDIILDSPTIVYNISRGKERSPLPKTLVFQK